MKIKTPSSITSHGSILKHVVLNSVVHPYLSSCDSCDLYSFYSYLYLIYSYISLLIDLLLGKIPWNQGSVLCIYDTCIVVYVSEILCGFFIFLFLDINDSWSTLLDNPQYFELKIKNKPIFNQQRTSTCSHERVNERKTNPTQQITRSHGYTSYLSGD